MEKEILTEEVNDRDCKHHLSTESIKSPWWSTAEENKAVKCDEWTMNKYKVRRERVAAAGPSKEVQDGVSPPYVEKIKVG